MGNGTKGKNPAPNRPSGPDPWLAEFRSGTWHTRSSSGGELGSEAWCGASHPIATVGLDPTK